MKGWVWLTVAEVAVGPWWNRVSWRGSVSEEEALHLIANRKQTERRGPRNQVKLLKAHAQCIRYCCWDQSNWRRVCLGSQSENTDCHGVRSLRQLISLYPQTGSRARKAGAQLTFISASLYSVQDHNSWQSYSGGPLHLGEPNLGNHLRRLWGLSLRWLQSLSN